MNAPSSNQDMALTAALDLRRSANFTNIQKGIKLRWLRILCLTLVDFISVLLAWKLADILVNPVSAWQNISLDLHSVLPILAITWSIFTARGLYKGGRSRRKYGAIVKATTLSTFLLFLTESFYSSGQYVSRSHFAWFWLFSSLFTCLSRYTLDKLAVKVRQDGTARYPAFLIANSEYSESTTKTINETGSYNVVSVADADVLNLDLRDEVFSKLHEMSITEVFIHWEAIQNRLFLCQRFQAEGVTLHIILADQSLFVWEPELSIVGNAPAMSFYPPVLSGLDFWIKRVFDLFASVCILILASPIYLLISLLIFIDSPGPVFYRQTRVGLGGSDFKVWKFRTMVLNADKLQKELEACNESKDGVLFKIKDDPRITRVGKVLRQYSLDELPQIFNVIVGEMSLVGPRPFPLRDVENFSRHHHIRQEVLPGITGLWQISGRSNILNFEQAYQLDLSYIQNWSLFLDVKILIKTVGVVFKKSGAY